MAKVITMGEIMLRLSTPNNEKFIQADEFDVNYGGGEANVAVSLANYGHDAEAGGIDMHVKPTTLVHLHVTSQAPSRPSPIPAGRLHRPGSD